jgi:hypothetical protein
MRARLRSVQVNLDPRDHERLVEMAGRRGLPMSEAIREAIAEWCDRAEIETRPLSW